MVEKEEKGRRNRGIQHGEKKKKRKRRSFPKEKKVSEEGLVKSAQLQPSIDPAEECLR